MDKIKRKLGVLDVKQAIYDERFQALFPELKGDIEKVLKDPGCACNREIYLKFFDHPDRLEKFFPNREVESPEQRRERLAENHWLVINCHISELESRLKQTVSSGDVQRLAVTRYEDQVTVVINSVQIS